MIDPDYQLTIGGDRYEWSIRANETWDEFKRRVQVEANALVRSYGVDWTVTVCDPHEVMR